VDHLRETPPRHYLDNLGAFDRVVAEKITGYTEPDGEQIGYALRGKTFVILEEQDGWIKIRLEAGGEGWIRESGGRDWRGSKPRAQSEFSALFVIRS